MKNFITKKNVIIVTVVVVLATLIGIGVYFSMDNDTSEPTIVEPVNDWKKLTGKERELTDELKEIFTKAVKDTDYAECEVKELDAKKVSDKTTEYRFICDDNVKVVIKVENDQYTVLVKESTKLSKEEPTKPEEEADKKDDDVSKDSTDKKTDTPTNSTSNNSSSNSANTNSNPATSNNNSSTNTNTSTAKPSKPANNNSANTQPAKPSHTHNWVAQTVHHEAEYKWVQDTAAYDEKVTDYNSPIYETHEICDCGFDLSAVSVSEGNAHIEANMCSGSRTKSVVVGYHTKTIHHEATGHNELVKAAYDEVVGYKCSCGATK